MTQRDLSLLANLARLRLASGEQLAALDGGSPQNVSRSLLVLWENEYVERVCAENLVRIELVTESLHACGDDRADTPALEPVRRSLQAEEPT
jgi:DNA-binding transcriptional ArsR family regulator